MLRFVEERTSLQFKALARYPDYHPEFDGGKPGGRSLNPGLFDSNELGEWKKKLRKSPDVRHDRDVGQRGDRVGRLLQAAQLAIQAARRALLEGIRLLRRRAGRQAPQGAARSEDHAGARDVGPRAHRRGGARRRPPRDASAGKEILCRAQEGVILASGGFEWNTELAAQFLGGPLTHPNSPPCNEGDGLKMAMAVGADLGNMSEAWWCPSVVIPGEEYDGKPLNRGDFATRSLPHSVIVNRAGSAS